MPVIRSRARPGSGTSTPAESSRSITPITISSTSSRRGRSGSSTFRTQANVNALDVDDRINTSHDAVVWDACHRLADAMHLWWAELDGILFRSRTTSQTSVNLAFFGVDGLAIDARPLHTCADELDDLILRYQVTIDFAY